MPQPASEEPAEPRPAPAAADWRAALAALKEALAAAPGQELLEAESALRTALAELAARRRPSAVEGGPEGGGGEVARSKPSAQALPKQVKKAWLHHHTFDFVDAEYLRRQHPRNTGFPEWKVLKEKQTLRRKTVTLEDTFLRKRAKKALVVSHRWIWQAHPDPEGEQMDVLREHLCEHPEVEDVWVDWCCLPQGKRSKEEQAFFSACLSFANLLYLGCDVLIIADATYLSRFWTQFEALLSMRSITREGLVPAAHDETRFHIKVVGIDRDRPDHVVVPLMERWSYCAIPDATAKLGASDVSVTNGSDKTKQLRKLTELETNVVSLWNLAVGAGDGDPQLEEEAESEEELFYSAKRERLKSALGALLVLACWAVLLGTLAGLQRSFHAEACAEAARCEPCDDARTRVLPLFGDYERSWPKPLRAVLYCAGLLWALHGNSVVSDSLIEAIEVITSAEKVTWVQAGGGSKRKFHVKVWNLTLARIFSTFGSAVPEVSLSSVEVIGGNFFAGALGPSVIMGSALFNMLIITAVCISAIPAPEVRRVQNSSQFRVAGAFSALSYVWLLIVLVFVSPDKIEPWEGILMFAFLPLFCMVSVAVDKGCCRRSKACHQDRHAELERSRLEKIYGKELPDGVIQMLQEAKFPKKADGFSTSSRSAHRKAVLAGLTGPKHEASDDGLCLVGFQQRSHVVLECAGTFTVEVVASRAPDCEVQVNYRTCEGTAKAGHRYVHCEGMLRFAPHQQERSIEVPIIDGDTWVPDESFTVELSNLQVIENAALGQSHPVVEEGIMTATVTILTDTLPGTLDFDMDEVYVSGATKARLAIVRTHGDTGRVTCDYQTVATDAIPGLDFTPISGTVTFEDGQLAANLDVDILRTGTREVRFKVLLSNASAGAKFDANTDGGETSAICEVVIAGQQRRLPRCLDREWILRSGRAWWGQCQSALYVGGDPEFQSEASARDWIVHELSLPFKLLVSLIPPPDFCGGWLCFCAAMAAVGAVITVAGDLASLLGCCLGIPEDVIAISLFTLGINLPDALASREVAQQDGFADSTLGAVPERTAVSVFLGLGLPWSISALYWSSSGATADWQNRLYKGNSFEALYSTKYPSGGLIVPAYTLQVLIVACLVCSLALWLLLSCRRRSYGGETGGPRLAQRRDAGILALLWTACIVVQMVVSAKAD